MGWTYQFLYYLRHRPCVHISPNIPFRCQVIPGIYYHGCWFPGSLIRQDIRNHDIDKALLASSNLFHHYCMIAWCSVTLFGSSTINRTRARRVIYLISGKAPLSFQEYHIALISKDYAHNACIYCVDATDKTRQAVPSKLIDNQISVDKFTWCSNFVGFSHCIIMFVTKMSVSSCEGYFSKHNLPFCQFVRMAQ